MKVVRAAVYVTAARYACMDRSKVRLRLIDNRSHMRVVSTGACNMRRNYQTNQTCLGTCRETNSDDALLAAVRHLSDRTNDSCC